MNNCAICGQPMKWINAGVSKTTGRPYNGFYACEDRNHKQPKAPQAVYTQPQPIYQPQPVYQTPAGLAGAKTGYVAGRPDQSDDIRANVALKMVSEILAAGVVPITEWQAWADAFYDYKPHAGNKAQSVLTPQQESEINLNEPPF